MKSIISILAICFSLTAFSQAGIRAGVNVAYQTASSNFFGNAEENNSGSKLGLNFGLFTRLPVTDFLKIETGIGLSQKGYTNEYNFPFVGEVTEVLNLNYLEVPAHILLSIGKENRLNIFAGPTFGYLINGNVSYRDSDQDGFSYDIGNEEDDDIERMDYGGTIGVGIQGPSGVVLNISATAGIKNLYPDGNDDDDFKLTNNALSITIGKMF